MSVDYSSIPRHSQLSALALLRAGASYHEAAERYGMTVEQVMELWNDNKENA